MIKNAQGYLYFINNEYIRIEIRDYFLTNALDYREFEIYSEFEIYEFDISKIPLEIYIKCGSWNFSGNVWYDSYLILNVARKYLKLVDHGPKED